MLRNKRMNLFDFHYQKRRAQDLALQQKVARERAERLAEAREDAEFDRIHQVKERAAKANDPLARLNRLATQLSEAPEYAEELAAMDARQAHQQAFLDAQQLVQNAQAKHQASVREAKNALAQQYQSNRW